MRAVPAKQSGNVALMTTVLTFTLLLITVFVLDAGRIYLEQERLNKLTDTVALDIVANTGFAELQSDAELLSRGLATALDNGFDPDEEAGALSVRRVSLTTDEEGAWEMPEEGDPTGDAVLVEASKVVPASLLVNLSSLLDNQQISDEITLVSEAVARRPLYAAFSTESRLLALDTESSPLLNAILGELLGAGVNLAAVSSSGLLNETITIANLAESLSVGSVSELLDLSVSAFELMSSISENLASGEAVAALQPIINNAAPGDFRLGDILKIESDDISLARLTAVPLNVGALLESTIFTINQAPMDLELPGTLGLTGKFEIISPPTIAIGPPGCAHLGTPCEQWKTVADHAQVRVGLNLDDFELLGLVSANLDVTVNAVGGKTVLKDISRPDAAGTSNVEIETYPNLVSLTTDADISLLDDYIGLLYLDVSGDLDVNIDSGTKTHNFIWPDGPRTANIPSDISLAELASSPLEQIGKLNLQLSSDISLLELLFRVVGEVLNLLTGGLESASRELEEELFDVVDAENGLLSILNPTLDALGISTNEVTVELLDVSAGSAEIVM